MPGLWFNGAADHLFELQIDSLPPELKNRAENFQSNCLHRRMAFDEENKSSWDEVAWAIQEAKDPLFEIDKFHGVPAEKGDYE